jgi:hypothetical protein
MCSEDTLCTHTKLQSNCLLGNTMKVKAKESLLVFAMLLFRILPPLHPPQKIVISCIFLEDVLPENLVF